MLQINAFNQASSPLCSLCKLCNAFVIYLLQTNGHTSVCPSCLLALNFRYEFNVIKWTFILDIISASRFVCDQHIFVQNTLCWWWNWKQEKQDTPCSIIHSIAKHWQRFIFCFIDTVVSICDHRARARRATKYCYRILQKQIGADEDWTDEEKERHRREEKCKRKAKIDRC